MKRLIHLIVLSCQRATFLLEKNHERPLSLIDRIQLGWHLRICENCTRYKKQSAYIDQLLKKKQINLSQMREFKLNDQSKERIKKVVEKEINQP